MGRHLQQETATFILTLDVYKTEWCAWVGVCNRKCRHWFWDGMFARQFYLCEEAPATRYVYIDSEMGHLQGSLLCISRHLQLGISTLIQRWDVYKTAWSIWEASATWNVYIDSKMGCLQDSLICMSSMRGNCNQKCLHRFWDGMFTRQFGPYERHLQKEMSTSILRWDVYKTLWSVQEASATGNVSIDSDMGRLQDSLICISVWEASAPGNVYIDS